MLCGLSEGPFTAALRAQRQFGAASNRFEGTFIFQVLSRKSTGIGAPRRERRESNVELRFIFIFVIFIVVVDVVVAMGRR